MTVGWHVPATTPEGFVRTDAGTLDLALRSGVWLIPHPGPCELDGHALETARRLDAGGVVGCSLCGRPVFVPPDTCVERIREEIHGTFSAADLRRP